MIKKYLQDDFVIVPVAFGLGLILSGRLLLGVVAVLIGGAAAFRELIMEKAGPRVEAAVGAAADRPSRGPEQPPRSTAPATPDGWYYESNGEAAGPLRETELLELFRTGKITGETAVFNAALGEQWLVFSQTHLVRRMGGQPADTAKNPFKQSVN